MSNPLLEVRNLKAGYNDNMVLRGLSFNVDKGEKVVIMGPSGSGKSTLLKCIPRLVEPWDGKIILDGEEITGNKANIRRIRSKIGFVFQQYNLFPHMTVLKNVTLALEVVKKIPREKAEKIALSTLSTLGLEDLANKYPLELSGGQQQRVAIARAIAINPTLLLLDEPTSALDPELRYEVLETLYDIAKQGRSMIIVTHELDFAEASADKMIFIENGYIVEMGDATEILRHPRKDRTKRFLRRLRQIP